MRNATLAAALLATLPLAAQAQDRPQIFPTRDVAVTYRVAGQGQQAELTMLWSAAQRLMRMNMPRAWATWSPTTRTSAASWSWSRCA
jgi:hypothetical protein